MQQQDFPLDQVRKNKIVDADQNPITPEPPVAGDDTQEQIERGIRAITALNTIKAVDAARSEAFR